MHYYQWQGLSLFDNTYIWELHRGVMYLRSLSQIHPSLHLTVQFFSEAVVVCHELLNLILFEEKYTDMKMFAKFQQGKKKKQERKNKRNKNVVDF